MASRPRPGAAFSAADARRFYDRFGARQDRQGCYEDPALDRLIEAGALASARRVFELGCGTGRLARRLLDSVLDEAALYRGVDVSETMVGLARERLGRFSSRAAVERITGEEDRLPAASGWADRFVATYVFDLLDDQAIDHTLVDARRILECGGLLCHAGITPGKGLGALVSGAWSAVRALRPALVGGCRPIVLRDRLASEAWEVLAADRVRRAGITSEVLVARRR